MIEALVFDFDGVIIDTETPQYHTWREVFVAHGVELDRSVWQRIIGGGIGRFDAFEHLEEVVGRRLDREEVFESKRERYEARIQASPVLPGVTDYIEGASELGLGLAVASSSSRDWVEGNLEARGLLERFDHVVCRDDVSNVKPDPELFLTAVGRLGTVPERAVAIEDSLNGVTAAKAAGMFCVAVPNPMTADMPLEGADLRLGALSEMGLRDVLGIVGGAPGP